MTTQAAIPLKWYVPFATGDASRVEIPVTSSDATRASQTLGFPPLTMQPPAVGGVPPQGEDFNGAMNQIARVAWWVLNGGGWPYDAAFATNASIGGYPNGAVLQSADFLGQWISTADNNQNNPDTSGTNWVPGFQYGATSLTGQTGGTVTLTPLQAAKRGITIAGALTSALVVIMPTWVKDWSITNNTTGAFTVITKTAAGNGVTIPQNGSPTLVAGDGTNINQSPQNIAPATGPTHSVPMSQVAGVAGTVRNLKVSCASGATSVTVNADLIPVTTTLGGTQYLLASNSLTLNLATTGAGGMDTGTATANSFLAIYAIYNPTAGTKALLGQVEGASAASTVYSGANMPSGYTASCLLTVLRIGGATGQLLATWAFGRTVTFPATLVFNTSTPTASPTAINMTGVTPKAAVRVTGFIQVVSTSASNIGMQLTSDNISGIGAQNVSASNSTSATGNYSIGIQTAQTIYYTATNLAGTPTFSFEVSGYEI